jgi:hypothetical protein
VSYAVPAYLVAPPLVLRSGAAGAQISASGAAGATVVLVPGRSIAP